MAASKPIRKRKWQHMIKRMKTEEGVVIVEATIIFPIVFLIVFLMIFLGNAYFL